MRKLFTASLFVLVCLLALQGDAVLAKKGVPESLNIFSQPLSLDRDKPAQTRFDKLEWIGTIRLTAEPKKFGGFSALAISTDGKEILALSDNAHWLRASLTYENGRPDRVINARMGKLSGLGGKKLQGKSERDAEGMALIPNKDLTGTAYISFERKHRIAMHKLTKNNIGPARQLLKLPKRVRSAKGNSGLEAITKLRAGPAKGALLAFTEDYLDKDGDHVGWLLGSGKPKMLSLKRIGGFSVTDMTSLDNGDVIVLERRFRFSEGVKMRLRRILASEIRGGATISGEVLFKADQLFEIDNMEGIASHTDAKGRTILTIISDDNFNRTFQRTLLMQFAIVE